MSFTPLRRRHWAAAIAAGLAALAIVCGRAARAEAQIRSPGHHPYYGVEIEPHLVWQWTGDEWSWEDGVGLGARASIPVLEDGPIDTLNNNLAITFGLDWAYFDGGCGPRGLRLDDCDESDIWVPLGVQWNFFVNDTISLFPELGLGFRDAIWSSDRCGSGVDCDDSNLEVHFVLWFGARFLVAEPIALVLRLGTPYLSFGVSFLL